MKLNAAAEMEPITWPEFARQHPFAPASDTPGLRKLIGDVEEWLVQLTGYDAVSLQPNAGSQGEYAGLLAIRAYHEGRGEPGRDVCLIPSSAHGTNAASAALAAMRVVVVACRANGDVDLDETSDFVVPACACGGSLKPDVVFFGENVPADRVARCYAAVEALGRGGALLVAGSSLTVMSGLRFVRRAAQGGTPVVIVNRGTTRGDPLASHTLDVGCSEFLTRLAGVRAQLS